MSKRVSFLSLVVLTIIFCMIGCTPEDASSPQPEDFFIKYYGTSSAEIVVDVLPYNGGFLILGSTDVDGDLDYLLVKTDAVGNQLWEQKLGFTRLDGASTEIKGNDTPSEMILYDDNNVAIIGTTSIAIGGDVPASRIFVVVVNVSSDESASGIIDTFTFPAGIVDGDITDAAAQASITDLNTEGKSLLRPENSSGALENAMILVGNTDKVNETKTGFNQASDLQDIYFTKVLFDGTGITEEGTTLTFGFPGEDWGAKVLQSSEGFNVLGFTDVTSNSGGGGTNILLNLIDIDGSIGSGFVYGDNTNETPADMVISGSKITILGNRIGNSGFSEAFMLITSTSGADAKENQVVVGTDLFQNSGNIGNGLIRLQNGDFFVTGEILAYTDPTTLASKQNDVFLYRTDQDGVIQTGSIQVYGGIGNDIGRTLIQNTDGTLMISATLDFQGGTTMMSLLKTNSMGEFSK